MDKIISAALKHFNVDEMQHLRSLLTRVAARLAKPDKAEVQAAADALGTKISEQVSASEQTPPEDPAKSEQPPAPEAQPVPKA